MTSSYQQFRLTFSIAIRSALRLATGQSQYQSLCFSLANYYQKLIIMSQMLSRRIAQAPALRTVALRRALPITQSRTFLPEQLNSRAIYDEKFPEPPSLTEAEDPNQVCVKLAGHGLFFGSTLTYDCRTVPTSILQESSDSSVIPMPIGGTSRSAETSASLCTRTTTSWECSHLTNTRGYLQPRELLRLAPSSS